MLSTIDAVTQIYFYAKMLSRDALMESCSHAILHVNVIEISNTTDRTIAHYFHACRERLERVTNFTRLAGESWNVAESEKVFECVLATYLEQFIVERVMLCKIMQPSHVP
jgi:hypothetical protein